MDDQKALARGKYEMKKEELQKIKNLLQSQAHDISEIVGTASESPTSAYINNKRDLMTDVLDPVAIPQDTYLDQLITKTQSFIESVKKYQEVNKEADTFAKQAR